MRFHHVYFNKTEGGTLYPELQSQLKQILKLLHVLKPVNGIEQIKLNVLHGIKKLKHQQAES